MSRPIAHRGLHDLAAGVPENTLGAFERARVAGGSIELDLQLAADGRIVVIHDDDLGRLTGRPADLRSMSSSSGTVTRAGHRSAITGDAEIH